MSSSDNSLLLSKLPTNNHAINHQDTSASHSNQNDSFVLPSFLHSFGSATIAQNAWALTLFKYLQSEKIMFGFVDRSFDVQQTAGYVTTFTLFVFFTSIIIKSPIIELFLSALTWEI
jgi:hypothetical protein